MIELVVFLGLVNWIATLILVEGVIFEGVRRAILVRLPHNAVGEKLAYLITCQLCAGTWVGFVLAALFGGPFQGPPAWFVNGLLIKAVGHTTLQLTAALERLVVLLRVLAERAPCPSPTPNSALRSNNLPDNVVSLNGKWTESPSTGSSRAA